MKTMFIFLMYANFICAYTIPELLQQGKAHLQRKDHAKALACYQQVYKHFPDDHNIIHIVGYLMRQEGLMKEAVSFYEKVLPQFPTSAQLHLGYAFACLSCGQYQKAWPSYEYRWKNPPSYNTEFRNYFLHHSIFKKRIVLKTEFGLGDSMQFIRYAQELKKRGAYIIIESHPELVQLFSLCPYIDEIIPANHPLPVHDFFSLLMSIPYAFNTSLETIPATFPYLYADETLVEYWHNKLKFDTNLKIGICWSTDLVSPDQIINDEKNKKNIPLALFAQLNNRENISLYSLQKNIKQEECIEHNITFFRDFDESHGSFMDTAALIENLDLIITMDTSVAHLAGAMNKPVWVLLAYHCDWRWAYAEYNQKVEGWYPSMKLFRQEKPGNWLSVFTKVNNQLKKLLQIYKKNS